MKNLTALLLSILFVVSAHAQSLWQNTACTCETLMLEVTREIETNYIGYHTEILNKRDQEYNEHKTRFLKQSKQTGIEQCLPILQDFIAFFKDGHLFIGQQPELDDVQKEALHEKAEVIDISEKELTAYFKNEGLDPIEGFWYTSKGTRYAIIKDDKNNSRDFVAVALSNEVAGWQIGHLKATFVKNDDTSYDVVYYNQDHFPVVIKIYDQGKAGGAHIRRNSLLHIPPFTWGRESKEATNYSEIIDSNNPRAPLFHIIDKNNVLISLPSHSPEHAKPLKKLVEKHDKKIRAAKNLIIDVRGNEGGSSWITNVLLPYLQTTDQRPAKYYQDGSTQVLSSEENMKYFESMESQGWLPKLLMNRLKDNSGKIIPLADPGEEEEKPDEIKEELARPQNVAILIGAGTVSAAEAFVIKVMKYSKVTLFGQPTSGCIDYQSVSMSYLNVCKDLGIYIGMPMFSASEKLPEGGVNKTGIVPDVLIDKTVKDKTKFIIDYYQRQTSKND